MKLQNYIFANQYLDVQDDEGNMFVGRVDTFDEQVITLANITRLDRMTSAEERIPLSKMLNKEAYAVFVGNDKMKYQFRTVVTRADTEQFQIHLQSPEVDDIIKIQNRDYLRISSSLRCDLNAVETEEQLQLQIYTHDISGGGLSFYSRQPIQNNKYVGTLYLYKGNNELLLPFKADLVYMNQVDDDRYKIALKYSDIKEQHRNHIIRYALQEQVRFRR
ncbi:PilZ domain-containing protein [Paenibacillus campi]|uniref:PilZ domain-containing protein n=1 Tax=Paenibacillus campi TaxID=3106031 RepID=UPI002AFF483F|nr:MULTISPECIES: PilZ domain-containing protein [unclassified Paenibacillus]